MNAFYKVLEKYMSEQVWWTTPLTDDDKQALERKDRPKRGEDFKGAAEGQPQAKDGTLNAEV